MRYSSASYTGPDELLAYLKQQLEIDGWKIDKYGRMNSGDLAIGYQLQVSKNGAYFGLRSLGAYDPYTEYFLARTHGQQGVTISLKTGFSDTAAFTAQPGFQASPNGYLEGWDKGTCHYFSDGAYVLVITNFQTDKFCSMAFGQAPTIVDGTGGQFCATSRSYNTTLNEPLFAVFGNSFGINLKFAGVDAFDRGALTFGPLRRTTSGSVTGFPHFHPNNASYGSVGTIARANSLFGLNGIIPIQFFVSYNSLYSPYAQFSNLFYVPLDDIEPGAEYVVGQRRFRVFPMYQKEYPANRNNPFYNLGLAVAMN